MNNELDPKLVEIFEEAQESLAEESFVQKVTIQIDRVRRMRNILTGVFWLTAALVLFAVTPLVVEGSMSLNRLLYSALPSIGAFMTTTAGWVISSLLGLLICLRTLRTA